MLNPGEQPSASETLKYREVSAALAKLKDAYATLTSEHEQLLESHEALLVASKDIDAKLVGTQNTLEATREEKGRLQAEYAAELDEVDRLTAEAASFERELHSTQASARAAVEAERGATAEALRRCDALAAEKHDLQRDLQRERAALLGRVAAAEAAAQAAHEVLGVQPAAGTEPPHLARPAVVLPPSPQPPPPPRAAASPSTVQLRGAAEAGPRSPSPAHGF